MCSARSTAHKPVPWLVPGEAFPPVSQAWGEADAAPGLLAAGGALDVDSLLLAYRHGIFPWFSAGQPILWWSTSPRMVLQVDAFRLHRSLRKTIANFVGNKSAEVRFDTQFYDVIRGCSGSPRPGQSGTWIVSDMVQAYEALHQAGYAHSVETWIDGQLVGGLYCVAIGNAVFGESMFTRVPDASKIALAALVCFCRVNGIPLVDCQQNTAHLASLGAREMPRSVFCEQVAVNARLPGPTWQFDRHYWNALQPQPLASP
ncbi:leucyl/phenylalanyl-tRNA--protein transferase [Rhodoferax sp. WC2427]|uniref:leucyl/phenylalanyl-tRNA--protein transferase n=1 Tax=Rhodoferax sp. WC2427 TaxID=3234144 RepID=UPI0034662C90